MGGQTVVEIHRDELPKPIARLHTCVPAGGMTQWRPGPERAGNAGVIFTVSCPIDGPGVVAVENGTAVATARVLSRARQDRDRRQAPDVPLSNPDGTMATVNVLPIVPSIGWSTKAHTSKLTDAAFFDMQRLRLPNNAFHLMQSFSPADRPELARVMAIWLVENGVSSLIYWAEPPRRCKANLRTGSTPNTKRCWTSGPSAERAR